MLKVLEQVAEWRANAAVPRRRRLFQVGFLWASEVALEFARDPVRRWVGGRAVGRLHPFRWTCVLVGRSRRDWRLPRSASTRIGLSASSEDLYERTQ
jgi:hypothetical protein